MSYPIRAPTPSNYNPRTRYLAALAEARAAEADYLAAEATQREEEALRRRLEEIELRRQEQARLQYYSRNHFPRLDGYPTYTNSRLAALRQQVEEEEEHMRMLTLREARIEQERRRREQEEESRLLALKRQQQAALFQKEREEALVAAALRQNAINARQRLLVSNEQLPSYQEHSPFANQLDAVTLHPALQAFFGPNVQVVNQTKVPPTAVSSAHRSTNIAPSRHCVPLRNQATDTCSCPHSVIHQRSGNLSERGTLAVPRPVPQAPSVDSDKAKHTQRDRQTEGFKQLLNLLDLPIQAAQLKTSARSREPSDTQDGIEGLRHLLSLFGLPTSDQTDSEPSTSSKHAEQTSVKDHRARPVAASADFKPSPSAHESLKEQLEARVNSGPYSEVKDTIQAIFASLQDAKPSLNSNTSHSNSAQVGTSTGKGTTSVPAETSLRNELEARLRTELDTEVKDTIQAIFASLQDTRPSLNIHNSTTTAEASKGKGKSIDEVTIPTTPTSKDVINSMDAVHSIETALQTLEDDFSFPQQLDFNTSHIVSSASPASTDSEASPTSHLAYTSRNHPVRFYEQALSGLLTQLDSIDSFGNDELRDRRKSVVVRVERALEELEREVEGRWRARLNKEAKAAKIQVTEPTTVAQPGTEFAKPEVSAQTSEPHSGAQTSEPDPVVETNPEPTTPATKDGNANEVSVDDVIPANSISVPSENVTYPTLSVANLAVPVPEETSPSTTSPTTTTAPTNISLDDSSDTSTANTEPTIPDGVAVLNNNSAVTAGTPDMGYDTLSFSAASIAASEVTLRGDGGADTLATRVSQPAETEPVEAFLLTASDGESIPKRPRHKESDDGTSDWSEIEA